MTALPDETVPKLPHGVRFREDRTRGGYILVGPERIFNADDVSAEILKRVDGRASLADIVEQLSEIFAADAATIRPDVESFLTDLAAKQMLTL